MVIFIIFVTLFKLLRIINQTQTFIVLTILNLTQ